jgi:RNA polymerase sigma-70 factor, ECF subfamily
LKNLKLVRAARSEIDQSYLSALAKRDPKIEDHLVASFTRPLKLKLYMLLRSPQAAEDACQETLLRVFAYFHSGKTLRTPGSLPAFIRSVGCNVALEMLRAHARDSQLPDNMADFADPKTNPERDAIASERRRTVRRTLRELSVKDRDILQRVCLEEEERDEVCEEYNVSRDYLRILLHRARLRFRFLVREAGPYKRA